MQLDRNGLEVLSRAQCLGLLAQSRVGRVVVTDRALPAAFPVNFALLDEDVVFMTTAGSKLEAAEGEEVMAFEADEIDPVLHGGWSVLVQGMARVISDPGELAQARALGLEPWAPATRFQFVRIRAELVSGRRLLPNVAAVGNGVLVEGPAGGRRSTAAASASSKCRPDRKPPCEVFGRVVSEPERIPGP